MSSSNAVPACAKRLSDISYRAKKAGVKLKCIWVDFDEWIDLCEFHSRHWCFDTETIRWDGVVIKPRPF